MLKPVFKNTQIILEINICTISHTSDTKMILIEDGMH